MDSRRIARGGAKVALMAMVVVVSSAGAAVNHYVREFDLPIPSPDDPDSEYERGWMDDAVMEIDDDFSIRDLNLHIGLTHGSLMDLQITLHSPGGTMVLLNHWGNVSLLDFGGSREIVFDDEAELSIEQAMLGFDGPYRPAEPLSALDEESAYGQWTLRIYDGIYSDSGMLHTVELDFNTPEPGTVFLMGAGAVLLALKRRR